MPLYRSLAQRHEDVKAERDRLRETVGAFLAWFDAEFPKGQSEHRPGLPLYALAERMRQAMNAR